ncbi:Gfo/Idh/MocA family oxidoreductase [Flavobacterium sp. GSP27]|uniref:Gfo/Idh/MocA family protein n=1 Tax=unclassified Flavobacterium TaxID=196869 RepID=UPI000F81F091|nr:MULTISPECIES: Gfo/Idh/MocA family oxidoreductase [unclassified Flavobacterium]RTY94396.1 Gfo/Idh/MocA family oxidoreductase [Flavobacterium sp. GSN2]RTY76100.1 Gfo/Idh/MocA family oxidoreductase [Flavobacterium sp. LS1R10]RTY79595.1 Gfo/Idh/MocA family oxidoreductase [Flavobacterium sp. LS1P28]RTY82687.1 Gfo/Idh/MocA family oxidoreductase [Flavobacterium sp. ZB4P23]RTZ04274.1 Gfo/Idh/MocA family oxidoreductase [Flavobacterium sp. GSP6]
MSEPTKVIRWGILGCGDVTELKSGPAYQKTDGFQVVAVMRRDAVKAADYAKRHGISKYYTNADDLINDPEIDAIYIATPPDVHKLYGLMVAAAGKICCIEKPLSPNYQDSLSICTAFAAKKIPLFVAYYRRTLPRFEQIKAWLDTNSIGDIRHIRWHLSKPASSTDLSGEYNWRTDALIAAGGYFDDLASHGLDLFTHLLGNIKEVSGLSINQQGLYAAKDAATACWLHESGITGTGSWNFGCYEREDKVVIYGSKGKITFSVFENDPVVLSNAQGQTEVLIDHPENIQLYHVQQMREDLLGHSTHPSTGLTATHTSWVMDQIMGNL